MLPETDIVVLYADADHPAGAQLEAGIRSLVNGASRKAYRTVAGLERRLCKPGSPRTDLVLLCPASLSTLRQLSRLRPLLVATHRVVMVLPDRTPETIAAGHGFFPRYIGFADGDLGDVFAVLARLLGRPAESPRERKTV
ncbi:MAG: hypothetical protein ACLFRG_06035 [Desulfococcaceae bacterium]